MAVLRKKRDKPTADDNALGKFSIPQQVLIFRSTIPKLKEYIGSMLCAFKITNRDKTAITDLCSPMR